MFAMKLIFFIAVAVALCAASPTPSPAVAGSRLLGAKECTWGPSYWCQNLTAAADCHAVKHCIQTVWIHKQLPPDTSSVCQTCLDMVKQARDQLESNETQELIKEVFEGSCALLHLKPIVTECDKIADNYIPELIDTLASEMNPQVVCSVAGLCNNEHVLKLLAESNQENTASTPKAPNTCQGCHTVVGLVEKKFDSMSRDDVLQGFLRVCRQVGSLSDACSNIVITYFTDIYNHLQENLNPTDVCLLAGECTAQFHRHANVEITPISHIGYVQVTNSKDDLPCELCEQLVNHLRDLLIANTTELEFKRVLEGLCNQTRNFKDECLSIVQEYYGVIYSFLLSELNSTTVCEMVGICPQKNVEDVIFAPLLPTETAEKALEITPAGRVNMAMEGSSVKILETPELAQLPIERIMPPHVQIMYDSQLCTFCEYFLHYVQQAITNPLTEDEIKKVVDEACYKLPTTINNTCIEFVNTYGDALVAILAQEIDPSTVCPLIRACPSSEVKDVEIFMQEKGDNSKCPLCLFAVSKLEDMVKDKKTEANIKEALDKLCTYLPNNLKDECNDFISTYADELIDMLVADMNPQEVCVYLKLCTDKSPAPPLPTRVPIEVHYGGIVETNEIPDNTYNGRVISIEYSTPSKPQCVLCEFIMKEIEDQLKNKKNDDDIKKVVLDVCNVMPKSVSKECDDFVDQYADAIIQLLIGALQPNEICAVLNLCTAKTQLVQTEILECAMCRVFIEAAYKILANPAVDHNMEHVLEKSCRALPEEERAKCTKFIDQYGDMIIKLILQLKNSKEVCSAMMLCSDNEALYRPVRSAQVGTNKCTYGPGYWCEKLENAQECGSGALKHCQSKVWMADTP